MICFWFDKRLKMGTEPLLAEKVNKIDLMSHSDCTSHTLYDAYT